MSQIFVSFDGDNAGQKVGTAVLMDDPETLSQVSHHIDAANQAIREWVESNGGQMISQGGDQGVFIIDQSLGEHMEEVRDLYRQTSGFSATFGIGQTLSQSGKALVAGKLMGKDQSVYYSPEIDQVLTESHQETSSGEGSEEAKKLDEQYLSHLPQSDTDHSESSDDQEGLEGELSAEPNQSMPAEAESDQDMSEEDPVIGEDKYDMEPVEDFEEESDIVPPEENQEAEDMVADASEIPEEGLPEGDSDILPEMESPEDQEEGSEEPSFDLPENDSMEEQHDPEELVADAAGDVAEEMDPSEQDPEAGSEEEPDMSEEDPDDGVSPYEEAIDPDQLAASPNDDAQANALSDESDQPSDIDVLSELLADAGTADDVKERVAAILQKFKSNRDLILSMREQAPELYESIMLMLKNMIDMAKHLAPSSPEEDVPGEDRIDVPTPEEGSEPPKQ